MEIIKPSFEILEQSPGLDGIYEAIERAGRTCYKSTRPDGQTAKDFVDRMIKSGHNSMLEHGTIYLKLTNVGISIDNYDHNHIEDKYIDNPYSTVVFGNYPNYNSYEEKLQSKQDIYITTNYRVLVENGWLDDLEYLCEPTDLHERRVTVRFTTDRGVSHEFVRHRVFSFAQESTRYCNYSKDKFGNELTFIIPNWVNTHCPNKEQEGPSVPDMEWSSAMLNAEASYMNLLKMGWTPQQARTVLPNSLKTELVVTGFVSDWKKFFRLRSRIAETGKPHPQAQELADSLMDEFVKRGLI